MKKIKPGPAKRILINILAQRGVILNKNSKRRRFIESFVKYILFQALEAKSLEDYFAIFFPPKEKMGSKTYADRMAGGVSKLKRALGFKRS
ncbi:MAG: hypothetical protein NTW09_06065 [Candidatus Omnitrophica bacterium]|nr:hypothetical protein [Candidatus Omnitrophota bacterium]